MFTVLELGGPTLQNYYRNKRRDIHDPPSRIGLLTNIVKCAAIALKQFHQRRENYFLIVITGISTVTVISIYYSRIEYYFQLFFVNCKNMGKQIIEISVVENLCWLIVLFL